MKALNLVKTLSLAKIKQKLEDEKAGLEQELQKFAQKDKKLPGDWDTRYPKLNGGAGSQALEDAADEVEEYSTRLPIEYSLETLLKEINLALEKIKKGKYGLCEKCKKPISQTRLKIYPAASTCRKCSLLRRQ